MEISITEKQKKFIEADADEVLFGGAAGGGKSYGQLIDAFLYALRYRGSKQLILRRSYAELEKSLIRVALAVFPRAIYSYNSTAHVGRFKNGSLLDFGYCAGEQDVFQYQSAEYDVIRFDELTHFTEFQYVYLLSRLRGANGYPKAIKSSTNPGGVGHAWVKARFIDPAPPYEVFRGKDGMRRVFIPSRVDDNLFLLRGDPAYRERLQALPEMQRRALLLGDWSIFEGQFFGEFNYDVHTVADFEIPPHFRRYRSLDYGLDRLACLFFAMAPTGEIYLYREVCESDLIISEAAERILAATGKQERIYATLAPPDLFSRSQESGRSRAAIFAEHGVVFTPSSNDREAGWLSVKELLRVGASGTPRLRIFRSCTEIIRCLPLLQTDTARPSDVRTEPHAITHAPDALRGFAISYARPAEPEKSTPRVPWTADMWEDYFAADERGREYLRNKYGTPL